MFFFFICTIYFKRIFQSILFFRIFPVHTLIWIHTAISFSGFSRSILLFGSIQLLGTLEYCIQHWPLAISLSYIAVQSIPLTAIRRSSICHRQNHFATGILPVCELKFGAWHNLGNFPFNGFCYFNSTACCPLTAIVFTLSYDMLRGMNVVFIDRVKWTEKEVPELHVYFNKQLVRFKDCEAARHRSKTEGGQLHRRHWETIKKKVNNMLQKT